jgi:hypothetical protein
MTHAAEGDQAVVLGDWPEPAAPSYAGRVQVCLPHEFANTQGDAESLWNDLSCGHL